MNRHQRFMQRALLDVEAVPATLKDTYGSLCHRLPVLVLTNGLAITVAFITSKATNDDDPGKRNAYDYVLEHLTGLLMGPGDLAGDLGQHVSHAPTSRYMRDTITTLDAAIFYKRFAESVLGVQPGTDPERTTEAGPTDA